MEFEKPNWSKWNFIGDTDVWKVVYLSLDINPDGMRYGNYISGFEKWQSEIETGFSERLEIIESNYNEIQGYIKKSSSDAGHWKINIPKFVKWAVTVNLTIPDGLKSIVQNLDLGNTENVTTETENSFSESQEAVGKREKQLKFILEVITELNFDALKIPDGGKALIKKECLTTRPELFTADAFQHAWKKGAKDKLFCMANSHKYSSS